MPALWTRAPPDKLTPGPTIAPESSDWREQWGPLRRSFSYD